ncbi:GmrSD restriction endonuclease domain-containing protein (plasmid) [Streptomyces sp. CA-142005]|uniref:GmrSD restriction endonuclease domain-containing protein n=1 Tax=Streptomyces sp. CA-142005 TaxID=3240052 RepID=UPI003D8B5713
MKASETILADLLQGRAQQYQIPLYQRTYSWTERQLDQLWRDILDQARLLAERKNGTTHFLGSVVLAPSPMTEPTFPRWLVVDGQQRLTTLSLALTALRDHLAATDPEARERIDEEYLINKRKQGEDYFRLLPTQADRAHYAEYIRGTHAGSGGGRVGETYRFFRSRLVTAQDPADPYDLALVEQAIASRMTLVAVSAEKDDNVHRIFESLNNTGLKLSQADLLRNYLFMKLRQRGQEVYDTYWLPLQEAFSNEDLEHLMWLQLVLDGDDRVRRQDLYTAQQQRFAEVGADEDSVLAYIKELHRRAEHFSRVLHPEREQDRSVREHLHRLQEWQASVAHPVVRLMLDERSKGNIDSAEVARALSYVESFLVRRMLCWIPTNNLNRIFQAVPGQLPVDLSPADGLRQLLSAPRRFWPTDDEVRLHARTGRFYERGRVNQRRFVLQRLEQSYDHPEPVDFTQAKLTVEHVMPQSAGPEWLAALAQDCADGETPEELHARLVHTLGNLTLTAVNSQLSNNPFDRKKDLLHASHLEMNRRIAGTDRWGATEILTRADELADRVIDLWPAPVEGVSRVERGRDWGQLHQALAALPDGTWTTYGDLAALIGSSAGAVGTHLLATPGLLNAHRVLTYDGRIVEGFQWADGHDRGDVRALLEAEGVEFAANDSALPAQRLDAEDLVVLLGQDEPEQEITRPSLSPGAQAAWQERLERFHEQLAADNPKPLVASVRELLDFWEAVGGWVGLGTGHTYTSAFLNLDRSATQATIWPLAIFPGTGRGGAMEVVFQHLASREPFTDPHLRDELRQRLNRIDGVTIPYGKLALRPRFPLTVLADENSRATLFETLAWFRDHALRTT